MSPFDLALSHGLLLTKQANCYGLSRRSRDWLFVFSVELQQVVRFPNRTQAPTIDLPKPFTLEDVILAMAKKCNELDERKSNVLRRKDD